MKAVNMVHKAMQEAAFAHGIQMYGTEPYFVHLQAVAAMVGRFGGDSEAVQVAWLHDILEDTDMTQEILYELGFSHRVVHAVALLTKKEGEPYEEYIAKIKDFELPLLVKTCDTLCNLTQSSMERKARRILKYTEQLKMLTDAI